jgi:hypothetical protein
MSKAAELAALIGSGQAQGDRNLIINGAMTVSQRGTSFTGLANNAYSLDRFVYYEIGDSVSDVSQSTDTPNNNFNNSLKLDVTTADASVAAGDLTCFLQKIEGLNSYKLGWGTSDAKSVTLSFYVKSTKTGVHSGAFKNSAQDRSYAFEYTVNSSNTWEFKTVTVAGDTSGTWLTTNGIGVQVTFALMAGTDFTKAAGSWGSGNNFGSDNQVNVMDSTSNEWYITGIQLEIGDVATAFEHEDYGTTLAKCQRYYMKWLADTAYDAAFAGFTLNSTQFFGTYNFPCEMRGVPTMAVGGNWNVFITGGDYAASSFQLNQATPFNMMVYAASSGMTAGSGGLMRTNNDDDAYVEFISEL